MPLVLIQIDGLNWMFPKGVVHVFPEEVIPFFIGSVLWITQPSLPSVPLLSSIHPLL